MTLKKSFSLMSYIVLVGDPLNFVGNYGLTSRLSKARRFSSYKQAIEIAKQHSAVLKTPFVVRAIEDE